MGNIKTSDTNAVRDMYDATAESYSEMMDAEIDHPLYSDMLDRLHARIANLPGAIIDAPCGSGQLLSMYHDKYEADRALFGVDLSPAMVEIAAKRLGPAAIDYGDDSNLVAVKHSADELERMMRQRGFSITRKVIELDQALMMDAVHIDGTKE